MDPLPATFLALVAVMIARVWMSLEDRRRSHRCEHEAAISRGELPDDRGPTGWVDPSGARAVPGWRGWAILGAGFLAYCGWYVISYALGR